MEININGYSYYFKNDDDVDDNIFIDRCWYIAKNNPTNSENYNKLLRYSRIWSNMINLKCKYNPELESKVKKLLNPL